MWADQDYRDLDVLKCFTKVSGTLVNHTPLRVGTGEEPSLETMVDVAVIRLHGKPYIPGSSLKGVLRATAEMLLASAGVEVHPPWEDEEEEKEGQGPKKPCVICGIFGSRGLSSHVRVYDAHPLGPAPVMVKPGVSIDRHFGSVKHLFFEEFVEPGVKWKFELEITNIRVFPQPEEERGKLLYKLLQMLKNPGLQVGARKTIGAGKVTLIEGEWEVYTVREGELVRETYGTL